MNVQQVGPLPGVTTDAYAIHTLVLDDSSFDRKRILRLGDRINLPLVFEEASSLAGLKHCLDRRNYDLFLIDYSMPDSDGLAALDVIREHHNHHSAASIMVSGAADLRVVIHAMKRGCRDFIAKKDMSPDTLYHAMMGALDRTAEPPCPAPKPIR
jgi:DNA-binding NarL/FixJ family response regulator